MQVTRREMLVRSGQVSAALALSPILPTSYAAEQNPIKITTLEGQQELIDSCLGLPGICEGLPELSSPELYPKVYPLHKWPELIKKYPLAFTWENIRRYEEFAYCVIVNELAGRAKSHFLPRLQNRLAGYRGPLRPEELFFNDLYYKAEELIDKLKSVPNDSSSEKLSYIRTSEGLFTGFTEEEAHKVVDMLTKLPYEEMEEMLKSVKSCLR